MASLLRMQKEGRECWVMKSPAEAGDQACLVEPIGPAVILISLVRTEKLKWWIPSRQQTGKNTSDTD